MNLVARGTFIALLIVISFFAISAYPVTETLISVWFYDTTFYHGFLVFPLFLVGCFIKKDIFDILPIRFEPLTIPFIAILSSIMMVFFVAGLNIVAHFFLVVCIILIVIAGFGRHIVKNNIGLILFLLFMIPFGTEFIVPLQNFTATISVFLLKLSGVDVTYQGIHIVTPNARFYVAEACAGLRFLIANVFLCYIFAYLNFKNFKSWLIFGCVSVFIPIIGNCLRAYAVMMIAYYSDGKYASGIDHIIYGWGFFSVLAFVNLIIGDKIARRKTFIETETSEILPFGIYDATRDKFYPYYHLYQKHILISFMIILLIPATLNHYFNNLFEQQKFNTYVNTNKVSLVKLNDNIPTTDLLYHFKDSDYETAYALNDKTKLQISYYGYQNNTKEVASSSNNLHNESKRLLLSNDVVTYRGYDFDVIVTGHIGGNRYLTLSTYFYPNDDGFDYTNSKLKLQWKNIYNLLYKGKNPSGIMIIDRAIDTNETPKQALDAVLKMMDSK